MIGPELSLILEKSRPDLDSYEKLYKDLHAHPELSLQESDTAAVAAGHLRQLGYEVRTDIGGHGLVGILRNGEGKTVLARADMDALPVKEETGLLYASKREMRDVADGVVKPVMHACGHDFHVTAMLAAAETLKTAKESWKGTLIVLFQPSEERGSGAQQMVDDGLYEIIPIPDLALAQHVLPLRAGTVGTRVGQILAAADGFNITIYGRGGHASQPHRTIDPVVMAAHIVVRLQTIVSREVDPDDAAVVTVGSIQAGMTENIIADTATIKVNIRTVNAETRERVVAAVKRIVKAECEASNAPKEPTFERTVEFPLTVNDERVTQALEKPFADYFGKDYVKNIERFPGSEDFSLIPSARKVPYCFWVFGGIDAEKWDEAEKKGRLQEEIPVNHSGKFGPVLQPTMKTGVDAMSLGILRFLTERGDM